MSQHQEVEVIPVIYERIRDYFNLGLVQGFEVWPAAMEEGWFLVFMTKNVPGNFVLINRRTQQPRVFKTLDAAVKALEGLGFRVQGFRGL